MSLKGDLDRILRRVRGAGFTLRYWDGDTIAYGDGAPEFGLRLPDEATVAWMLGDALVRLPEAYVAGDLGVDGDLQHLLHLCYRVDDRVLAIGPWRKAALALAAFRRRNSLAGAPANVSHHYDIGNEFFATWLDDDMNYSCAYFEHASDDLPTAQRQKLRHICGKLRLQPGDRLLDIGCGWGALARHAATHHGVGVVGITLSEPQRALGQTRVREHGLADRVELRRQDYRELGAETFDRVVSVGMIEHVGERYLPAYMASVARGLRPGGIAVLHTMGKTRKAPVTPWITKHIFPGMYLPTLAELSTHMTNAGLRISDVENLRPHYALTIEAWIDRFEKHADAIARMFDERFVRMWRMYLHAARAAFVFGALNVWQLTCSHGSSDEIPLTRRHLYEAGRG
ncbi:MAG: class I SAM-dependent methyltransferase [Candidatus Rokubacteria bacterium]|nr:class I SAM-dependent methyltransferase [Candidatus Rokubacteria bacterium]